MDSHKTYFIKLIIGMIAGFFSLLAFIIFLATNTTKGRDLTFCRAYNDLLVAMPKQELIQLLSASPTLSSTLTTPSTSTPSNADPANKPASSGAGWRFLQLGDLYIPMPTSDSQALQIIQTPLPKDKAGLTIRIGTDQYISINRSPNPDAFSYGVIDEFVFEKQVKFQEMMRDVLSKNFRNPCDPTMSAKLIVRDILSLWFKKSVVNAGFRHGQLLHVPHGFSFSRLPPNDQDTPHTAEQHASPQPEHITQIFFSYKHQWIEMEVSLSEEVTRQFMELLPTMIYGTEEAHILKLKDQDAITRYATFLGF